MFAAVIHLLIYLCLIAIVVFLVQWVLGQLGIAIPQRVMQILWVIVVLIAILLIYQAVAPYLGSMKFLAPVFTALWP